VQGDVSVAADRERLVATTIAECGGITGLVNNAGIAPGNETTSRSDGRVL
jgi:3-oxoacyl-[acyl-carrier protein] reductase